MISKAWPGLIALALTISACGVPRALKPEPDPTRIEVELSTVADLNPDPTGRASPVVFRLYELKDSAAFNSAVFFDLYEQADQTLGEDLLGSVELFVQPGATQQLERTLDPNTRHLGLLAAYRDPDAVWRALADVTPNETNTVEIILGRTAIRAAVSD